MVNQCENVQRRTLPSLVIEYDRHSMLQQRRKARPLFVNAIHMNVDC